VSPLSLKIVNLGLFFFDWNWWDMSNCILYPKHVMKRGGKEWKSHKILYSLFVTKFYLCNVSESRNVG
jgi:hypothetical protein